MKSVHTVCCFKNKIKCNINIKLSMKMFKKVTKFYVLSDYNITN